MANTYRSILQTNEISPLKDAYRNKVFNSTELISAQIVPFNNRSVVNEGQVVVDTDTRSVWMYVDFSLTTNLNTNDYYGTVQFSNPISTSIFPKEKTSDAADQSMTTDPMSSDPTKSFFLQGSYILCVRNGQGLTNGDRYVVYGSWQY